MKSTTNHSFSRVPQADIPRSSFDRSSGYKTTIDAGKLYPFFVDEVVPGDTFNLKTHALARLATPLHPTMDNMFLETFYFFVPNRLVWDNWEKFQGQQDNPEDSIDYLIPQISLEDGFEEGKVGDYFGLPLNKPISVSALPFRGYRRIYNEWFRDENLANSLFENKDDGPDEFDIAIVRRGKRHDYFTSCLPAPQKGESVPLPLGSLAPISSDGTNPLFNTENQADTSLEVGDGTREVLIENPASGQTETLYFGSNTGLQADLSDATAATINELRQAFQIQRMLERDMRSGTRYVESIKAHFGVTSPDFRLQRTEYLGGGSTPIHISTIHQSIDDDTGQERGPLGKLAGIGTAQINGHGFTKSFTEHGFIIGLINCRADLTYQNQINRMWSRETRYDHYYPALSRLGEQAVLNKEIFYQGTEEDEEVFGYQEIYAEMRYKPSLVTNQMRSESATTLDSWHLAQDFLNLPTLSAEFIQEFPPIDRIIAVPSEPHFILDVYHKLTCARPMPTYGTPGMIDHF